MKKLTNQAKLSILCHSIAAAIAITMLVLCAFYDLSLSEEISNANSFYGALFAVIGEWPAYLTLPLAAVVLFYNAKQCQGKKSIVYMIISGLICFGGLMFWNIQGEKLAEIPFKWGFAIFYSLIWTAVLLYCGRFIKTETMQRLFKFAVFAITVVLVSVIIINILKLCWGRMRFRDMLAINSFDGFTGWYSPNGYRKGDFTSFPSGHTASAANIFIITVLPMALGKPNVKLNYFLQAFCTIFVVLTAFSRVVYNAHFLSDTVVGGAISYIVYYVSKTLFFKNDAYCFKKEVENVQ